MRKFYSYLGAFIVCTLLCLPGTGSAGEKYDIGAMLDSAASQWKEAEAGMKQAAALLEEKKVELMAFVEQQIDRGFLETSEVTEKIKQVVIDVETKMKGVVSEENMQRVVAAIESMGEKLEDGVNSGIIDSLSKKLALTSQQLEEAKPLLEEELQKRKQLVDQYLEKGGQAVAEFNRDNQQLCDDIGKKLKNIFSEEQMATFDGWRSGVEKQIGSLLEKNE